MNIKRHRRLIGVNSDLRGRIISSRGWAMLSLAFLLYGGIWGVVEPLNIIWINDHHNMWRTSLIVTAIVGAYVLSIPFGPRILQIIDAGRGRFEPSKLLLQQWDAHSNHRGGWEFWKCCGF